MGIIKKLLMKQHSIEMNEMNLNQNMLHKKKNRILTMDGKIIDNTQYLRKSHDTTNKVNITMANNECEDVGMKTRKSCMKKRMPEERLMKLCKYLAGKTKTHNQIIFGNVKKSLENFDENNFQINQSMLCSYNGEQLYQLDNGIINKAMIEFDEEVETNLKANERLFDIPLNRKLNGEQQNLQQSQQKLQQRHQQQHQQQQQQQEQNKRDILLKIRQQILERKRLRSKLYQTTTQVWRPW